ncbi:MAG: hypothetical protein IKU13_05440 [Clostridia bacterium]|nr:hypothetical protein [Clostridia bacterium]
MWLLFGISAIVMAIMNIVWTMRGRDAKWLRFASLSLTALTLCAFYNQGAAWVISKDWSALEDVVPSMSKALWIMTVASISINSISLFKKNEK